MSETTHPNVRRVTDAADALGLTIEVRRFPESREVVAAERAHTALALYRLHDDRCSALG